METVPWEDRKGRPELDGDIVIDELSAALQEIPGIQIEVLELGRGPGNGKTRAPAPERATIGKICWQPRRICVPF